MRTGSFREFIRFHEAQGLESVGSRAAELMRQVRNPQGKDYIEEPNLRELVLYALEEVQRFALKLPKQQDRDEAILLAKQFKRRLLPQLYKSAPMDRERLESLFEPLLNDLIQVVV